MKKTIIGIDLSINSTGLVILNYEDDVLIKEIFYRIIPEELLTSGKKNSSLHTKTYKKNYDKSNYSSEDLTKVMAAARLGSKIKEFIDLNHKLFGAEYTEVRLEGSVMATSFRSHQARLNDLTAFNTMNKFMLLSSIKYLNTVYVIAPTSLKKLAVGKGNAKKELMIEKFFEIKPKFDTLGKMDDVVDAYFLGVCEPDSSLGFKIR